MKKLFLVTLTMIFLFTMILLTSCNTTSKDSSSQIVTSTDDVIKATDEKKEESTNKLTEEPVVTDNPLPDGVKFFNILLMGAFSADFSNDPNDGYALTHIIITFDPYEKVVKFVTIPYNLAVNVKGEDGVMSKTQVQFLSSSFGPEKTVEILGELFGVKLDGFVMMNMMGGAAIIDALGGIELNVVDLSINEVASHIKMMLGLAFEHIESAGKQVLNGIQTAGFFINTMPDTSKGTQDDWIIEEEESFRKTHETILKVVINTVNA